jgi:hypothetical protein
VHLATLRALLAALVLAGCAPAVVPPTPPAPVAQEAWVADRLYFGRRIPGGGTVGDDAWAAFLRDVVTPRFPAGLTVWRAQGQWRDAAGSVLAEDVVVVEILHSASPDADAAIEEIAGEYRRRFRQEAVMRVRAPADARFFE